MNLGRIDATMNEYEVADALLLSPFSSPATWRKRIAALEAQGRTEEATIAATFTDLSDEAQAKWDRDADRVVAWGNRLMKETG